MDENPYADGKIRSYTDAIVRAVVVGVAAFTAWNVPYAWYWKMAIFLGIMFALGVIYPAIQLAWSRRND